jgi:non-ribosomal peptide synthetase component E (peptide arylation enzyme)
MDPIQKRELKRQAWMRLAAQRRRAGLLRGRVVVASLICFAVLWAIVFAQMTTGNDPVLADQEKASTTRTVASVKREVETTDPRELEAGRQTDSAEGEEEFVEEEPGLEEEPEFVEETEPELFEAEEEPLVTSQS